MAHKKIVILGAGFGGLRAATLIAKKLKRFGLTQKYEVILIDKNDHHTYTPLLYEVATTSKETADLCRLHEIAAYKIKSLVARLPIKFIQSEIKALDLMEGDIHLKGGTELIADFVVLALGSETNYFGIKGLKENSLPLKTFKDAVAVRDAVWNLAMEKSRHSPNGEIKIVIGGGGATGVELAGELKAWCGELEKDFKKCRLDVKIIEAQATILGGLAPKVIALTETRLKHLGIDILANEKIVSASKDEVTLGSRRKVPFNVFIWAGGIKSPSVISKLPLHAEPHGRPITAGEMECLPQTPNLKLHTKVYGLGDSICFYDPKTQKPIPAVARAAIAQARVVAHNIIEEIKQLELPNYELRIMNYAPKEYPYIIPVGGKYAIAKIGPFVISGFLGWILKGLVELNYLLSIMPPLHALKIWLKGLKIFIQNDRLG